MTVLYNKSQMSEFGQTRSKTDSDFLSQNEAFIKTRKRKPQHFCSVDL